MFPLKKILCPLDFSDYSIKALESAKELADKFNAKIVLQHVITNIPTIGSAYGMIQGSPTYVNMEPFMKEMEQSSEKQLDTLIHKNRKKSIHFQKRISTGLPADEIVQLAKNEKPDLIVLTTHGRTGLSRMLLGSVAEAVIRHAPCPVLAIRIKDED